MRVSHTSRVPDASTFKRGLTLGRVLSSWKEVATFFGRGVRTVQRWEKDLQLPIRRPADGQRHIVFADTDELAEWATPRTPSRHGVVSVMLVDTNHEFRKELRSALEERGYFVFCCANENQARFIREEAPRLDLFIASLEEDGASRVALTKQVTCGNPGLPVLLIVPATPTDGTNREAERNGWIVVSRPLSVRSFLDEVDAALARAPQLHRETPAQLGAGEPAS